MEEIILTGNGVPQITANYVGQKYVDVKSKELYFAFGISSKYDWGKLDSVIFREPPVLTITKEASFYDSLEVVMSTDKPATIYYSTDGSEPNILSNTYSTPLILEEATTIKAFAVDEDGNDCNIQTVEFVKLEVPEEPLVESSLNTSGLILHYDFTNKAGTNSNTVVDLINGVEATLFGILHDGSTDGYVDNAGILLQVQDWIQIPTNTSPLNKLIDLNSTEGLTIQIVSYDTNGVHWKTDDGKVISYNANANFRYIKSDGTEGVAGADSYWFTDSTGYSQMWKDVYQPKGSQAVNTFTFRLNADRTRNTFINDSKGNTISTVPVDFVSFSNTMSLSPLQLRRNYVGVNTGTETLVAFLIYNRALTDEEVRNNHKHYVGEEPLTGISVNPSTVMLNAGESQFLSVQGLPNRYTPFMNITFESGNEGFVTVDGSGVLTGVADGETNVAITATYKDQSFTEYVIVKVGGQVTDPPTSTRVIDGMSINRKTDTLYVGESFSTMATALSSELPYDIYNDNIVIWESSNPKVAKVQYGVIEGVSTGTATLTAYDSTKSYSASFDVEVIEPVEIVITEAETYHVNPLDYGIKTDNSDSINTTNGIRNALVFASQNGYKKIVFPYGTYLITPVVGTIYPPSDMVIDFSDSILNIEPSEMTKTGYTMFHFRGIKNTTVTRMHVYGERDYTTTTNSTENCLSVIIDDAYNVHFESCTFSKSPGFNFSMGTISNRILGVTTSSVSIRKDAFELGNIDENGNLDNSKTKNYYRYNQYMDVSGVGEYYLVGYTQGYHGYPHLRSRLYSIHFYDQNYNHIESQMYNLQFYNYDKPSNANYAKIVIYQESPPTTGDSDFHGAVAFIRTIGMPRKCSIKNSTFEDSFSTGIAACGGQGWLIEGNTFSNNKGRMPSCDIDWEDGWEHSVGDIVRNNTFNSPLGVIVVAGGSLAAFNNTFNRSALHIWGRTQNWRVFNNMFNGKPSMASPALSTQGDSVFARNILKGGYAPLNPSKEHATANYKVHANDNTFVN